LLKGPTPEGVGFFARTPGLIAPGARRVYDPPRDVH